MIKHLLTLTALVSLSAHCHAQSVGDILLPRKTATGMAQHQVSNDVRDMLLAADFAALAELLDIPSGGIADGDYSDITVGAGGTTMTIKNGVVTLAKMANLAQDQFIGRTTASTGVPQTATITAAARTVLDDTTVAAMVNTLGGATSTGSGGLVRATSPTLVTPNLGTPSTITLTNGTGLPLTGLAGMTAWRFFYTNGSGVIQQVALGTAGDVLTSTGATSAPGFSPPSGATLPRGYLADCNLAWVSSTQYSVAAGAARSDDNTTDLALASAMTKSTASWSAGSGNGSLDTGTIANNAYAVFLISNGSATDVLLSLSATAPTMPGGYTKKRRVGWVVRAGGVLLNFIQRGDSFYLDVPVEDLDVSTLGTSRTNYSVTAPPSVVALISGRVNHGSAARYVLLTDSAMSDSAPSISLFTVRTGAAGAAAGYAVETPVSTTRTVSARADGTSTVFQIVTRGWIDYRR